MSHVISDEVSGLTRILRIQKMLIIVNPKLLVGFRGGRVEYLRIELTLGLYHAK